MNIPLILLAIHFVADFVLQTDWMATNKSKRWDALALHVSVYSGAFLLWALWHYGNEPAAVQFAALTWVTHFATDAVTSLVTSRLWFFKRADGIWAQADYAFPKHGQTLVNPWIPEGGNRHWFFVAIGFDQLIHAATLAATWRLFA